MPFDYYGSAQPHVNINQIITEAEKEICTALPTLIEKRTDEIIEKILINLNKNVTKMYGPLLSKFKDQIEQNLKKEIEEKITKQYEEISKKFIEEVVRNVSNDKETMDAVKALVAKQNSDTDKKDKIDGGSKRKHYRTGRRRFKKVSIKSKTKRKWQY